MKQLIVITAMLLGLTAKLVAQNKSIEVINQTEKSKVLQNELHQFEIVANENVEVNVNVNLKKEDNINVIVTNKKNQIVYTDTFKKSGQNKLRFDMEENEKYTVKLNGEQQSNLIVEVTENK